MKFKKLIFILVALMLVFATVTPDIYYADNTDQKQSDNKDKKEEKKDPVFEQGETDGKKAGDSDGNKAGIEDKIMGEKLNYKNKIMTDDEIKETYKLELENATYRAAFMNAYKLAFIESYEKGFRETDLTAQSATSGEAMGGTLGAAAGANAAVRDYNRARTNDPDRAYKEFLAAGSLKVRYHFNKEDSTFAKDFTTKFAVSFREAYQAAYRTRFLDYEVANAASYEIPIAGETFVRTWNVYNVSEGGASAVPDIDCMVEIEPGTIYSPTYLNVSSEQFSFNENSRNYRYLPVTANFRITLDGITEFVQLRKPIKISLNIVGSENAGIYQWKNYRWIYLPTEIDDEGISTIIPAGNYSGGTYAVFIDENVKPFTDTGFSWARKEINAFKRRHYFVDNATVFKPDEEITRGELAVLLYRMLSYKLPYGNVHYDVKDRAEFGDKATAIDFCITNKLLTPCDGYFYPNLKMEYQYVSKLAHSLTGNYIDWSYIANQMMQNAFYKSPGLTDRTRGLTRAEAVYFLFHFVDK